MSENPVINKLPQHLKAFIVDQNYSRYTAQDQEVWRYVMRQNVNYLKKVAHKSYLDGLQKTGVSVERIPSLEEMNDILAKIGWAAVTVDGFIPPAAFMEFQEYNVLVIAADIRTINHIEYTPAPDIIHEAAGHAPIIADPEYAEYLRYFGKIGSRAFSSKMDYEMYEVIRHLSILKADPYTPAKNIEEAEACLDRINSQMGMPSEMTLIRNLHWWTVEYGLIGDLENPKIYGAGLLSSIGEGMSALQDKVIKLPYTIDAIDYSFDITKPQPQLFVTPDFKHLTRVLNEFAGKMALKTGGIEGVMKAIESGNTATLRYSSGLQISGTFTDYLIHKGQLCYIRTTGPTTLNYKDKMLEGHSKNYHKDGFGSPVGRIKGTLKPTRLLTNSDLKELGIEKEKRCTFSFESGVKISGYVKNITRKDGRLLLISFTDCLVKFKDKILFEPAWGIYDMAIGETIKSAYSGPADAEGFELTYEVPGEKTHQIEYKEKDIILHDLYFKVRKLRQPNADISQLQKIWDTAKVDFPEEWLLQVDLYEIAKTENRLNGLANEILQNLNQLKVTKPELSTLIANGIKLAGN
jgi:phenylalanine-4-hydroxylase